MKKYFDFVPVRVSNKPDFEAAIDKVLSASPKCARDAIRKLAHVAYDAMPSVEAVEFESVFSDTLGQIADFAKWCFDNSDYCWPVCRFVAQKDVSDLCSPYNSAYVTPLLVELLDAIDAIEGGARKLCYLFEEDYCFAEDDFCDLLAFIDEHDFDCIYIYGYADDAAEVLRNLMISQGVNFATLPFGDLINTFLDWDGMLDYLVYLGDWCRSEDDTYFEIAF